MLKRPFQYLNDYFDKIYVLTLSRLKDRSEHITHVLKGLDFEFFEGIDKQKTNLKHLKAEGLYSPEKYRSFYKRPQDISLGMLCCSLGHVRIYEKIIENRYNKTLILEDDVVPNLNHLRHFPEIISELPEDWELFYLGYEKNELHGWRQKIKTSVSKILPYHSQLKLSKEAFANYYPSPLSRHIAKAGFHDCTHAYSITASGAKKLLQQQVPVGFNPDNLLSYMVTTQQINGYICKPKLFTQLSAFNDKFYSLTSK